MKSDYIVVLNNGTHYTDEANAHKILSAVEDGIRLVEVALDFQGDGKSVVDVNLALTTFVMLYKAPSYAHAVDFADHGFGKVSRIH